MTGYIAAIAILALAVGWILLVASMQETPPVDCARACAAISIPPVQRVHPYRDHGHLIV